MTSRMVSLSPILTISTLCVSTRPSLYQHPTNKKCLCVRRPPSADGTAGAAFLGIAGLRLHIDISAQAESSSLPPPPHPLPLPCAQVLPAMAVVIAVMGEVVRGISTSAQRSAAALSDYVSEVRIAQIVLTARIVQNSTDAQLIRAE